VLKTIEVTQDDIDAAVAERNAEALWDVTNNCPVARAATRAFGVPMHANHSDVHDAANCDFSSNSEPDVSQPLIECTLPIKARKFVEEFDNSNPLRKNTPIPGPITFRVKCSQ